MKPQDFQVFLARLGELTPEQKSTLASAMAGSRQDSIAIIEARFSEGPFCPHCQSRDIQPWGRTRDLKRWRCREAACRHTFTALTGPAGLPPTIVTRLNAALNKTLAMSSTRDRFAAVGADVLGGSTAENDALVKTELAKWMKVAKAANIKLD